MNVRTDLPPHISPRHPGHTNIAFNYDFDEIDLTPSLEKEEQIISVPKFKTASRDEREKQTLKMWNYYVRIKKMMGVIAFVLGYENGRNQIKGMVFLLIWTLHCCFHFLLEFFEALLVLESSCWCTSSIIYFVMVIFCYAFVLRHNVKWYLRFVQRMAKEHIFYRVALKLRRVFKILPVIIWLLSIFLTSLHYGIYSYHNYTAIMVIFKSNRTLVNVNRTLLIPDEPYKTLFDVFRFTSLLHVYYFFVFLLLFNAMVLYSLKKQQDSFNVLLFDVFRFTSLLYVYYFFVFLLLFNAMVLYSLKKQQDSFNAYIAHKLQPTPPTISLKEAVFEFYYRLKVLHEVSKKLSLVLSVIFISTITSFVLNVYNYLLINRNTMRIIFSTMFLLWVLVPLIGGSIVTSTYRRLYLIVLQVWIEKQDNVLNSEDLFCNLETEEYGDNDDRDNFKEKEEEIKETMLQKMNPLSIFKRISAVSYHADDEETDSEFDASGNHNNQDKNGAEAAGSMIGNMMRRLSCQPPSLAETRLPPSPLEFQNGNLAVIQSKSDYSRRRFSLQPNLILDEVPEVNRLRKVPSENTIYDCAESIEESPMPANDVRAKPVAESQNNTKKNKHGLVVPPRPRKTSNHLHLPMSENPVLHQRRRSSIQCAIKGVVHKGHKMRGKTKKESSFEEETVPNPEFEEAIKRADELMTAKINEKLKEQSKNADQEYTARERRLSRQPLTLSFREEIKRTHNEDKVPNIKEEEATSPTKLEYETAVGKSIKRYSNNETDSTTSGSERSETHPLTKSSRQQKKTPPSGDMYRIMALQNATKTTINSRGEEKRNFGSIEVPTDSDYIESSDDNHHLPPRIEITEDIEPHHKKGAKSRRHSIDFLAKKIRKSKRGHTPEPVDDETLPYENCVVSPPPLSMNDGRISAGNSLAQLAKLHNLQSYAEEKFSFEKFVRILRLNDDIIAFNVAQVNITWRRTVFVTLLLIAVILSVLRKAFQEE